MTSLRGRPSLAARRSSVITTLSTEHGISTGIGADPSLTEEIEEIKRYEDFTTIDWVQDAAREQIRRRARHERSSAVVKRGRYGFRQKLWELYDAGQAWIVVTLVGIAIGLNAGFLNIVTEWLSDIKLGHCTTAFYLNQNFCCWGAENGCDEWHSWSSYAPVNFIFYLLFAILFAFTSSSLVKAFAPYAAGSGISEIKCIIAGFVMKGFLGFWTLLIKSIGLPLAIASGLSVGKEGPSVHYAVCTGNVVSRFFSDYKRNASKTREILSATAAAGVAVAFGSPIGGVLFSLEEMSSYFPLRTMWKSYFCALVATAALAGMNPFRTGQLVMFQVSYDRVWHFFEIPYYILLGIFGGLYGALVIRGHLRVQSFRKKYLSNYPVQEAVILAAITAVLCYPNMFLRIDMTEMMEILFEECEGKDDFHGLCNMENRWRMIASLAFATVMRTCLVMVSYGCKVPAGIFVPSMAIGASFGRMVGILVEAVHHAYPNAAYFAQCEPDVPCITPGTYAFLGAAAALSGIMHITVSVVVIMFELTGSLYYILPTMIVCGTTKIVSSYFPGGGIADRMIAFNGFPFLDTKEEHDFDAPVSACMRPVSELALLPISGLTLRELEQLLTDAPYGGFPIVSSREQGNRTLVGYLGRTELLYAINKARAAGPVSPDAICSFSPVDPLAPPTSAADSETRRPFPLRTPSSAPAPAVTFDAIAQQNIDFARFIDPTPLTVHPRLALETTMDIFKKMGPRVILVESKGKLTGLVTVKDCLKYQFREEAAERQTSAARAGETDAKVWNVLNGLGSMVGTSWNRIRKGHIRLGSDGSVRPSPTHDFRVRGNAPLNARTEQDRRILDGTEDVELEDNV